MKCLVDAQQISKKYNNRVIVKPSDFQVNEGSITVIEGKSGSGKSTFLGMLAGLEKPTKGRLYYQGKSFYQLSDEEQSDIRGSAFGFVFQSFQLIPELTVRENIELPLNFSKEDTIWTADNVAKELGIDSKLEYLPGRLSGGEQQRVAIARALITAPKIIFADEPTGNLDSKTTKQVVELFTQLNKKHGIAFVIVTHEKGLIKETQDLYMMENGVITGENHV
ncbi:ABC transporter ATP-binding protein [Gracilibacillus sp. S3-1-1]|uniref:ABC transporter ATP-binding protein n=1 Tax=Gracilibacillus pellucidus TaxID=3095368 RepID=A0ACC6M1L2_9BACI|nr:ABC transporter ATP-binding protein [Gracilibacillus sp. S3-1-1]MDX8044827.1 ABC transporter ATP-binding protein [Gracilibacillus sp. S3-1-1]